MHRAELPGDLVRGITLVAIGMLFLAAVPGARAQNLPPQLLLLPWEMPRPEFGQPGAASTSIVIDAHSFELPDSRHAELYRLSIVRAVGARHHARFTQDYAGLESEDRFQWGGGRTEVQWTSRLGALHGVRGALEAAGSLSTGDERLHPLSAGSPSLRMRTRLQWLPASSFEFWTGVAARMVSPPSDVDRQAPRSVFPSGFSSDATLRWLRPRWFSEWQLRYDLAGLPQSWWAQWRLGVALDDELSLRLAAHAGLGPTDSRMIDHGWSLGLSWSPAPSLSEPSEKR